MKFYSFAVCNSGFFISAEGFVVVDTENEAEEKVCNKFKIEKESNRKVIIQEQEVFEFPKNWLH